MSVLLKSTGVHDERFSGSYIPPLFHHHKLTCLPFKFAIKMNKFSEVFLSLENEKFRQWDTDHGSSRIIFVASKGDTKVSC